MPALAVLRRFGVGLVSAEVGLEVDAGGGGDALADLGFDLVDKDFRPAANTLLLGFALLQVLVIGLLADLVVRVSRPARSIPPGDVSEELR